MSAVTTRSEHPFRHAEIWPLCVRCKEITAETCPRCATPLCATHRLREERRCDSCEREFSRTLILLPVKGVTLLAAAVAGVVIVAVALDCSSAPPEILRLLAAAALLGILSMPLLFYLPRWEKGWRRRFLAQRKAPVAMVAGLFSERMRAFHGD